jgi:cytochrome c peroxidase
MQGHYDNLRNQVQRLYSNVQLGQKLTAAEVADIVAFLNALTGEFPKQEMPVLPGTAGL